MILQYGTAYKRNFCGDGLLKGGEFSHRHDRYRQFPSNIAPIIDNGFLGWFLLRGIARYYRGSSGRKFNRGRAYFPSLAAGYSSKNTQFMVEKNDFNVSGSLGEAFL
ncbi:hypothetical protein ACCI51_10705 [Microbulbifer echini]|uniref:Uncharacterized protein n=1 Tax=Microbulbifer echini TaxID=1529067 RepID=A0ABV4NNW9_9GAMM